MSAFFVTEQTIHDCVTAWADHHPKPRSLDRLTQLGRALWRMNAESVNQRYNLETRDRQELADMLATARAYQYQKPRNLWPAQAAKSVACLEYQSCEGTVDQWPAYKAIAALRDALGQPFGFDLAQWDRADDAIGHNSAA